jgi:hypothetical protein
VIRTAGAVLLLVLVLAAPARASDVSAGEFRALVERRAVAELRAVDSVDGRKVDVAGALGEDPEARLDQLARTVAANGSTGARADAHAVLQQGRFHEKEVPGPFRSLFDRLADLIPSFGWLADLLPGGGPVVWSVLAAILAAVATVVARKLLSRRVSAAQQAIAHERAEQDPRTLDRQADEAERAGDLETALRLRFRAGLLRLDRRGAIVFRPSISTREVQRTLRSDAFDGLAATFDDVVYGGRAPAPADVDAARRDWPEVVDRAA